MARPRNLSRVAESVDEVDRFAAELDRWLASAAEVDALGRYSTQIAALAAVLRPPLARCRDHVSALAVDRDSGAVYDDCRRADRRVVFLRRLFRRSSRRSAYVPVRSGSGAGSSCSGGTGGRRRRAAGGRARS
ncbi:hypothetical protein Ade02nite_47640 [Paractinoplanes deccanensis]|uniref:Uncharacterized protein n=1 Tax=Paractinoplanes deccanensis TaxID=113561 RepID=A0ABQ3Y812_9ACTN|nr:hypothetical protein [Actinoplanes deccanensis]GID76123.1 hypothetical protein Ade02nite_47640 [Actinoplanes deccanensis]